MFRGIAGTIVVEVLAQQVPLGSELSPHTRHSKDLTPDQAARQLSGDDLTLLLEAKRKEDAALEEAPADADLEGRIGKNPISFCKHGTAGPG